MGDLRQRLSDKEDNFTERKPWRIDDKEIRRAVVAFANAISEEKSAVLFIGVSDRGEISGAPDGENIAAREEGIKKAIQFCYPSIKYRIEILDVESKKVIAVEVLFGNERPYFAGAAYFRKGSSSTVATEEIYNELIATRNSKTYEILKWKGKSITVLAKGQLLEHDFKNAIGKDNSYECEVVGCDAHSVDLKINGPDKYVTKSLEDVKLSKDQKKGGRLKLIVG